MLMDINEMKIYAILESYNSVILEDLKKDKQKRDVEKARKSYHNYAKKSKKNPWLAFLDWKKEHPKLYWGLVIGLGLVGGIMFASGMSSIGSAGAGFEKAAFDAIKITNTIV
jgi:hypothetical protein